MKLATFAVVVSLAVSLSPTAHGAVSAQEAARLGADLTPLGGEKAGNAAGTIPAWDGGLSSPAKAGFPNFAAPGRAPDPFPNDKPLFKITPANMAQYADHLTEGQKAMLRLGPVNAARVKKKLREIRDEVSSQGRPAAGSQ